MGSLITFGGNGTEYTVSAPQYGYSSKIVNSFHMQRKLPSGYRSWDDGSSYDYREFNGEFLFNASDAEEFISIIRDDDKGRGVTMGMRLPINSGFTPFAPDKGDYGNYTVCIRDVKPSGRMVAPYGYFAIGCNMVAVSYPSVSAPTVKTEGGFQIGTVTGLRFPINFPINNPDYRILTQITRDGTPKYLNKLESTDHYETTLNMICNRSRTYALIDHLVVTVRTSDLNIVAGNGTYLFGIENGSGDTYSCQWIDEEVTITHRNFDRYEFQLNFGLVQ